MPSPIEDSLIVFENIKPIIPAQNIGKSIEQINENYHTLYTISTAIEQTYVDYVQPIVEYYQKYKNLLFESSNAIKQNSGVWEDFYTMVRANSSVWIVPMTVFYPNLIQVPLTDNKIAQVGNWLKKYYPIKNVQDGTLNYVESQKFIVSCYVYDYVNNISILDQPYSLCNCRTQSGLISLHCQTLITGGWINCNQGSYNCSRAINCYPQRQVDCWYETPYLKSDGSPILPTDPVSSKQTSISKIQADIRINYVDRREKDIKNLIFIVEDCEWSFLGEE
jgi:hypothetical protein